MLKLFKKNKVQQKKDLELISVHIPKTAGTSFRNTLKSVYGQDTVVRLDIPILTGEVKLEQEIYSSKDLPETISVLHGHFNPNTLLNHFSINDDIPMITWLRNPVDRVISNFYYLEKRLKEELDEESKGLNILSKMQRNLMEYAHAEINRNRQSKFLNGVTLEEFLFVGIQEEYSADLQDLSKILKWSNFEEMKHNVTGGKSNKATEAERQEIAKLNHLDMEMYEKALRLRVKRRNAR